MTHARSRGPATDGLFGAPTAWLVSTADAARRVRAMGIRAVVLSQAHDGERIAELSEVKAVVFAIPDTDRADPAALMRWCEVARSLPSAVQILVTPIGSLPTEDGLVEITLQNGSSGLLTLSRNAFPARPFERLRAGGISSAADDDFFIGMLLLARDEQLAAVLHQHRRAGGDPEALRRSMTRLSTSLLPPLSLVSVVWRGRPFADVLAETTAVLPRLDTGLFARSADVVVLVNEPLEPGEPPLRVARPSLVGTTVARKVTWLVPGKDDEPVPSTGTPPQISRAIADEPRRFLRRLGMVSHLPSFDSAGSLIDEPGYDSASQTLYVPTVRPALRGSKPLDVDRARDVLFESLEGLGIRGEACLANAVALCVSGAIGRLAPDRHPLWLLTGPTSSSSAQAFVEAMSVAAFGTRPCPVVWSSSAGAIRDLDAHTELLTRVVSLQGLNSSTPVGDPRLARWMSTPSVATAPGRAPLTSTTAVIAAGGGLTVPRDMVACSVLIELPLAGNPDHPIDASMTNRAAVELIDAWVAAASPRVAMDTLPEFSEWCAVIGGVLATAGIEGFLGNSDELELLARTPEEDELAALLRRWSEVDDEEPRTAGAVVWAAEQQGLLRSWTRTSKSRVGRAKAFTTRLRPYLGVVYDGRRLRGEHDPGSKQMVYWVERV